MSHTPGPWIWEPQDASMMILGKEGDFGVDLENTVLSVTRCESCQTDPERLLCFMPNDDDARLIAAAPDLLEALRELAEIGDDGVIERRETGKPTWSALEAIKTIARAAIAKATE